VPRALKHWGWGYEDEQLSPEELRGVAEFLTGRVGFGSADPEQPVPLSEVSLPQPRLRPPEALAPICSTDASEPALHAYGRSYSDVARAFRGRFDHLPDVVARPGDEGELQATLDWAQSAGAAVIPFGGGTSVVGGYTHIDDLVESVGALTPIGVWESRRLPGSGAGDPEAVRTWREAFLRAPYLRDVFTAIGVLSETFETAITWERFTAFQSPTITRSVATTGPGTTVSGPSRSRPRSARPRRRSIRPARSTPEC
jgi:FAD binding domain